MLPSRCVRLQCLGLSISLFKILPTPHVLPDPIPACWTDCTETYNFKPMASTDENTCLLQNADLYSYICMWHKTDTRHSILALWKIKIKSIWGQKPWWFFFTQCCFYTRCRRIYIYAHGTRRISQNFSTMENENKKCLRAQTLMILSSSSVVTSCEQKVPEGINLHDLVFIQCCDIMRTKSARRHKPPWSCLHPVLWHRESKRCLRAQTFMILSSSSAVSLHDADVYR